MSHYVKETRFLFFYAFLLPFRLFCWCVSIFLWWLRAPNSESLTLKATVDLRFSFLCFLEEEKDKTPSQIVKFTCNFIQLLFALLWWSRILSRRADRPNQVTWMISEENKRSLRVTLPVFSPVVFILHRPAREDVKPYRLVLTIDFVDWILSVSMWGLHPYASDTEEDKIDYRRFAVWRHPAFFPLFGQWSLRLILPFSAQSVACNLRGENTCCVSSAVMRFFRQDRVDLVLKSIFYPFMFNRAFAFTLLAFIDLPERHCVIYWRVWHKKNINLPSPLSHGVFRTTGWPIKWRKVMNTTPDLQIIFE